MSSKEATPHDILIEQLLDPRIPKSEREHAAVREIERLRAILEARTHDHTHECGRCGLCYTPVYVEEDVYPYHSEDCPNCGYDGKSDP